MTAETSRIEAFSDGIFAIAITLWILNIKIPPAGSGDLYAELVAQWPSYFSFLVSFTFIGIMWINHHRLCTHIARSDDVLLILNLLLLGVSAAASLILNFALACFFALPPHRVAYKRKEAHPLTGR